MTPEQLKASILQYAIQGKLVEQRPEEGTGEELYRQIQAEKQRLVEKGKLKKERPLAEIVDEEIPFDIPDTWKWVRLDDAVQKPIKRGKSPTYTQQSNTLVFAQKCNTKAGYINLDIALFLDEQKLDKYPNEEFMQDYDIVINSTGNGTLGRVGMYRNADNPKQLSIVPDSHVTVIRTLQTICVEYVYYVLKHYQPYMEKLGTGSTNQTELSASTVRALLIPLPPLAEQKRIVAKIEELLPYVDRYAAAYERLERLDAEFPQDMKKSILQYAIQGRLVEQRPEEGTGEELYRQIQVERRLLIENGKLKKEKSLPEIAEDEKPFDIPGSWRWVRIPEIGASSLGKTLNKGLDTGKEVPYLCSINVYWDGINLNQIKTAKFTVADMEKYLLRKGDLLICEGGDVGRSAVWDRDMEMYYQNALHCVRFFGQINPYYFKCCFELYKHNRILENASKGMTIKHLVQGALYSIPFPLPPLAEQNRIVAKLEEILPLCGRLG